VSTVPGIDTDGGLGRYYSAEELSELFGPKPRWFLRRAQSGELRSTRFGRYVRFAEEDVRRFLRKTGR
jgi:excisionase family DNA binding protein